MPEKKILNAQFNWETNLSTATAEGQNPKEYHTTTITPVLLLGLFLMIEKYFNYYSVRLRNIPKHSCGPTF